MKLHRFNPTPTNLRVHVNVPCLDDVVPVLPVASTVTCVLGGGELEDDAVTQDNTFPFHTLNNYTYMSYFATTLCVGPWL